MDWINPGACVLVHGVNDDYVGRVVALLPGRVVSLTEAAWVSDSGKLSVFVATGKADGMEIEPVGDHVEHWQGITRWDHPLFKEAV